MFTYAKEIVPVDRATATAARLGFWVNLLTALLTIVSFAIAILTPPRSGPFCTSSCVAYPYNNTTAFFPRDYIWMFPAILLTPLFLIVCACAHSWVAAERRIFTRIALLFAAIAASSITLNYFIQIQVIQPSLLHAETNGIAVFSQYNPHGIFIAMEDLGYLMMSAAFFFLGAALAADSCLGVAARWLLMVSSILAFVTFIVMSLYFGSNLEYNFEIVVITISWATLAAASILLSILFRRSLRRVDP
jgi:hypothetical protein